MPRYKTKVNLSYMDEIYEYIESKPFKIRYMAQFI